MNSIHFTKYFNKNGEYEMNKIEVYKFVKVKQLVYQLIKLYRTNDMNSHKTQKDFLLNEINDIFKEKDIDISDFITSIDDVKLTKKKSRTSFK